VDINIENLNPILNFITFLKIIKKENEI